MNSNIFEPELLNYFSEVIYVNSNPFNLKIEKKFKENGKLKTVKENLQINLKTSYISEDSKNLMIPECSCYGISDDIKTKCLRIELDSSVTLFEKLYTSKGKKIEKYLKDTLSPDNYIITSSRILKMIPNIENKIFINDTIDEFFQEKMSNFIIIGKKNPIFLLNKYSNLDEIDSIEVSYSYDNSQFQVIKLV